MTWLSQLNQRRDWILRALILAATFTWANTRARIVRNHLGCAMWVWVRLKPAAHETGQTIYQEK